MQRRGGNGWSGDVGGVDGRTAAGAEPAVHEDAVVARGA